jgi:hypothetical protein
MGSLFCALFAGSAFAQAVPLEIFGGYSLSGVSTRDFSGSPGSAGLNGLTASVTAKLKPWFGIVGEFSRYQGSPKLREGFPIVCPSNGDPNCPVFPTKVSTHLQSFLFGPQVSVQHFVRVTPFVHALFGLGTISDHPASDLPALGAVPWSTTLATALGGGIDFKASPRLSWRFQGDYRHTGFFDQAQNNFRVSTGLVFHLGQR